MGTRLIPKSAYILGRSILSQHQFQSFPALGSKFLPQVPPRTIISGPTRAHRSLSSSNMTGTIYDFTVTNIDDETVPLSKFKGKVLLVVNVASHCGFTPQYTELVELESKYESQGFDVLAFPCNQFGNQENGTAAQIKDFAASKGANFPLFAKIKVNGGEADPLYKWLKSEKGGFLLDGIKWNFTKFLVDREGKVVGRYAPTTKPNAIAKDIEKALAAPQ